MHKKITAIVLIVLLVSTLTLAALGKVSWYAFWTIAGLTYIVKYLMFSN